MLSLCAAYRPSALHAARAALSSTSQLGQRLGYATGVVFIAITISQRALQGQRMPKKPSALISELLTRKQAQLTKSLRCQATRISLLRWTAQRVSRPGAQGNVPHEPTRVGTGHSATPCCGLLTRSACAASSCAATRADMLRSIRARRVWFPHDRGLHGKGEAQTYGSHPSHAFRPCSICHLGPCHPASGPYLLRSTELGCNMYLPCRGACATCCVGGPVCCV